MQGPIGPRPLGVGKAARAQHHAQAEGRQGVGQGNGVGTAQLPGQVLLHLLGIADLAQKLDEADQPPKGCHGPGGLGQFDFGFPEKRRYNGVHRSVLVCRSGSWFEPILLQILGTERLFSNPGFRD
jgi:hypothetical protein